MTDNTKAVDEMAMSIWKKLCETAQKKEENGIITYAFTFNTKNVAEYLYLIGYRKQSDTEKEFAYKVIKVIEVYKQAKANKGNWSFADLEYDIKQVAASFGGEDNDG